MSAVPICSNAVQFFAYPEVIEVNIIGKNIENFNFSENQLQNLDQVKVPLLVIQAQDDPVVDTSSAAEIIDKVDSDDKSIEYIALQHHVIVRGEGSAETFQLIDQFLTSL